MSERNDGPDKSGGWFSLSRGIASQDSGPAERRAGQDDGDEDAGLNSNNNGQGVVGYRTYKRRWIGLVSLALMNIVVSWDVSHHRSHQ